MIRTGYNFEKKPEIKHETGLECPVIIFPGISVIIRNTDIITKEIIVR